MLRTPARVVVLTQCQDLLSLPSFVPSRSRKHQLHLLSLALADGYLSQVISGQACVNLGTCLIMLHCRQGAQSGSSKQPEGSWAHEQYEEDAAFSKYTKRLQRCPGQCLRLSTSGSILWPRKELPAVPRYIYLLLLSLAVHGTPPRAWNFLSAQQALLDRSLTTVDARAWVFGARQPSLLHGLGLA